MKISYVSGVCVPHDAISNSIRNEIAALQAGGMPDVRLYAYECRQEGVPFCGVNSVADVALDPHFQSSSLVVFHFGIFYPLFDLLPAVPKRAKRLVVFHNVTPKEFTSPELHRAMDRSSVQLSNMCWADHVVCDSETNLAVLRSLDIQVPASVIPVAVPAGPPPKAKPCFADGIVRLAFVGRFVRSKGALDVLAVLPRVLGELPDIQLQLDLVGNIAFSDKQVVEQLRQTSREIESSHGARVHIHIHGDAPEEVKQGLLRDADLFVLPTYHEGFCVPIVEAFAAGCKVIAYENSNTPAISGGLATLTPTGDLEALARAIKDSITGIRSEEWQSHGYREYVHRTQIYVERFEPSRVGDQFLKLVRRLTSGRRKIGFNILT